MNRILPLAVPLVCLMGCVASTPMADAPVPASEPRATMRLRVDLVRAQDCEEAFDLALYRSRAVELIEWDAAAGRCTDRTITIRYLTQKTSRDDVMRAASAAAAKVSALPETNGDSR
ncbi:Hypothetical protein A7982_09022 [Minicystis rosea]|nr:Hypothetical protein A7982_09022 [Minicystis rosea]